jgi:hypothetical protein
MSIKRKGTKNKTEYIVCHDGSGIAHFVELESHLQAETGLSTMEIYNDIMVAQARQSEIEDGSLEFSVIIPDIILSLKQPSLMSRILGSTMKLLRLS